MPCVGAMLELAILGFLAEGPSAGHLLRRRVSQLTGYTRPVSDGSLYPAINRLARAGHARAASRPCRRPRPVHAESDRRGDAPTCSTGCADPAEHDITDFTRFFVVLTFLSQLPDVADQHAVLRRRLKFLDQPASFFYDGQRPMRAEELTDPYRRGMLLTARAISTAERTWLREILDGDPPGRPTGTRAASTT